MIWDTLYIVSPCDLLVENVYEEFWDKKFVTGSELGKFDLSHAILVLIRLSKIFQM